MNRRGLFIVGAGAQTPLGRRVEIAAAGVRCGVPQFFEHPTVVDQEREPVIVSRARWLDVTMPIPERLVTMAADAAREALHPLRGRLPSSPGAFRVHLALDDRTLDEDQRRAVAERFAEQASLPATDPPIGLITEGHAGGLRALEIACDQLRREVAAVCLVGGVDSYIDPHRLTALDRARRLHSPSHSWGFVPGEGAGFVVLTTGAMARQLGLVPHAELLAVATAREANLMGTRTVCLADGLTAAFHAVLDPRDPVSHSYCDLNGEPYRADELGFTLCRMPAAVGDLSRFTAPVATWGDMGAASGVLAVTLPLAAWSRGYAAGPVALVWSSSADRPLRAAALLRCCESIASGD